jgi:hypothetical protein
LPRIALVMKLIRNTGWNASMTSSDTVAKMRRN